MLDNYKNDHFSQIEWGVTKGSILGSLFFRGKGLP